MEVVTVDQYQRWYRKSRRTPYLTTYVALSTSLSKMVCKVRDELRHVDSRQIYSPSSYLHATVKELGWLGEDVREEDLPAVLDIIRNVASEQAPFNLSVEGIGIFPTVIFGKVRDGADEIRGMNAKLVGRLGDKATRSKYDGKSMEPHISIAHFKTRDVDSLLGEARRLATRFVGKMRVREIQVKKSYPHRLFEASDGRTLAVNEPLARFKLGLRAIRGQP